MTREMGTNHVGCEGVEIARAVEHGGARTGLSFHEHLRKIRCQRQSIAPPIPEDDATRRGRSARRSVTSSLEAACDGWREVSDRSPPRAPRRRAAPAWRATAAAARRGMVARVGRVLDSGEWEGGVVLEGKVRCGPLGCRDGKKLRGSIWWVGVGG